jgi:hypothetical protein
MPSGSASSSRRPWLPRPFPQDVRLRVSPEHSSMREVAIDRSFRRMSGGRASVDPARSQAASMLRSFAESASSDDEGADDGLGLANVTYDPKDPWSSPRGKPRESTPPLPQHNFMPGVTALARSLRQRSIYTVQHSIYKPPRHPIPTCHTCLTV